MAGAGRRAGAARCASSSSPARWTPTTTGAPPRRHARRILENTGRFEVKVAEEVAGHHRRRRWRGSTPCCSTTTARAGAKPTERAVEDFVRAGKGLMALHGVQLRRLLRAWSSRARWRASAKGDPGWTAYPEMLGASLEAREHRPRRAARLSGEVGGPRAPHRPRPRAHLPRQRRALSPLGPAAQRARRWPRPSATPRPAARAATSP